MKIGRPHGYAAEALAAPLGGQGGPLRGQGRLGQQRLLPAGEQVHGEAPSDVRARPPQVQQKLVVLRAASVEEGIGKDGEPGRVKLAGREQSVFVGGLGQPWDESVLPGPQRNGQRRQRPDRQRSEEVAKDVGSEPGAGGVRVAALPAGRRVQRVC
jgi:hypothetical protein